ncbi:MAG: 30S ribosomal protein S13 [bacterium]|nr:30S ribosomal protein S13 [bacterium]
MARILGVDLPSERKIQFALTAIYGVGPVLAKKIISEARIPEEKRAKDLTDAEVSQLQKEVEKYPVEGDLGRTIAQNIRRLEEIGSYRGYRHKRGLPVRGQRTKSNSRTKRGKRQTVGARRKEMRSQMTQKVPSEQKGGK